MNSPHTGEPKPEPAQHHGATQHHGADDALTPPSEQMPPSAGQRSRIVPPSPPAPVPEPRAKSTAAAEPASPDEVDRSQLRRAPSSTASAPSSNSQAGSHTHSVADATAGRDASLETSQRLKASSSQAARLGDAHRDSFSRSAVATKERNADLEKRAPADVEKASDSDVVRSTGSMAIATLFSRITGFLRTVALGATLGTPVASAFNTANTLPNLITEIVLGAVLTSLVVPVLVRAEKEDPDKGAAFIRRLFTLSMSLLIVVTVVAVLGARFLTTLSLGADGQVNIIQSGSFAYLLLPQIFFYGIFALFMAVLNTKGIFKPGAWAPVANNIVTLAVLGLYWIVPGSLNPSAPSAVTDPHVLLLGLGTTAGVVVQALIMIRPLRRAGVDLRPLWGLDERLKTFGGMALAIVVYVAISQAGYIITNRIASASDVGAPFIYQQHWLLLQVPYGIVGVTLLTAIMPRLSRNAADGDDKGVVRDLTLATKLTFIALIPIVVFFTGEGRAIAQALFAYGRFDEISAERLGLTLAFSAFTLIPYSLVLLHLRVFYAREEAWTPTFIIGGITITKVVLSYAAPHIASSPSRVVILLGAANGFGFLAGAMIGGFLLRRKLGHVGTKEVAWTTGWALSASLVGLVAAWLADWGLDSVGHTIFAHFGSFGVLVKLAVVGIIFLIGTGITLSFSGLPEVHNLGAALRRIPGMRRFIRPDTSKQIEVGTPTEAEVSTQIVAADAFNASPVPPPMSAGVVRGPRLVPGAPVSGGRFRLIASHGNVPGARFWQAKEQSTGRMVALVFVDTTGTAPLAPISPARAASAAAEVLRRTRLLARLNHPGIAPGIEVSAYRSGCLVVADWVPGSSLKSVVEDGDVDPYAAAYAVSTLSDAVHSAHHEAHTPLGLDNKSRIRIDTNGTAILAFPAVLPQASTDQDLTAISCVLDMLIDDSAPDPIRAVREEAHKSAARAVAMAAAAESGQATADGAAEEKEAPEILSAGELATNLKDVGLAHPSDSVSLAIPVDPAPPAVPEERRGFGSKGYSSRTLVAMGAMVILMVTLLAGLTAYLAGLVSGDSKEAPINTDSLQGTHVTTAPRQLPVIQPLGLAFMLDDDAPARDEWHLAPQLVDDDADTAVPSNGRYLVMLQHPVEVRHIVINSTGKGPQVTVRAVPPTALKDLPLADSPETQQGITLGGVDSFPVLAEATLSSSRTTLDIEAGGPIAGAVIVEFTPAAEATPEATPTTTISTPKEGTRTAEAPKAIEIKDISVVGMTSEDAAKASEAARNDPAPKP